MVKIMFAVFGSHLDVVLKCPIAAGSLSIENVKVSRNIFLLSGNYRMSAISKAWSSNIFQVE